MASDVDVLSIVTKEEIEAAIKLSFIERCILKYLYDNHNRVVSVKEIGAAVWTYEVEPALVRVHIARLRKKLGHDIVGTIPAHGYVFNGTMCTTCGGAGFVTGGE